MCRIYEDMISDKIPQRRYESLNRSYELEEQQLQEEKEKLKNEILLIEKPIKDPKKFIRLIDKYDDFKKLDTYMINEFVEKIIVHERKNKGSASSPQTIEIYFNFIGRYDLEEKILTDEEKEELKKKEEKRKRLHENYIKRKANGKQKEYEERYKERREKLKQERIEKLDKPYELKKDYKGEPLKSRRV